MASEDTIQMMADRNVWLSLQPFEPGDTPLSPAKEKKSEPTCHWHRVAAWAKKHGTKVAAGTDVLFQPGSDTQSVMLPRFGEVFGAARTMRILTSGNTKLFAMSGPRNPY